MQPKFCLIENLDKIFYLTQLLYASFPFEAIRIAQVIEFFGTDIFIVCFALLLFHKTSKLPYPNRQHVKHFQFVMTITGIFLSHSFKISKICKLVPNPFPKYKKHKFWKVLQRFEGTVVLWSSLPHMFVQQVLS